MKITGIDTNALLSFRLNREPYVNEVKRLLEQALKNSAKIYIPIPVILEVEWVLRSYYKQGKDAILPFFDELLKIGSVMTDSKDEIKLALNSYRESSSISFSDSIIVILVQSKDYDFLTFDHNLKKIYKSLL